MTKNMISLRFSKELLKVKAVNGVMIPMVIMHIINSDPHRHQVLGIVPVLAKNGGMIRSFLTSLKDNGQQSSQRKSKK